MGKQVGKKSGLPFPSVCLVLSALQCPQILLCPASERRLPVGNT